MTDKTLPEKARFMAEHIERLEYSEWTCADHEISQLLEDLAAEIESESKAADEMQGECNNWHYQYQLLCEHEKALRTELDNAIKEVERLQKGIRVAAESVDSYMHALEKARAERDELINAIKLHLAKLESKTDDR